MTPWTVPGLILSYLVGAIPFGYLMARARGVDLFAAGSGNIGATNVGRVLGKPFGFACFVLDFLKGAVPVAVAKANAPEWVAVLAGLAAFLGHVFPVYLRFRGGKGVATGFGVVTVLLPGPAFAAVVVWLAVLLASRVMSLASAVAAVALAVTQVSIFKPVDASSAFAVAAAVMVVVKHRANFGRLIAGTESRMTDTPFFDGVARMVHVASLSLWFGGGVFFSLIAAPLIFATFAGYAGSPPEWLPVPRELTAEQANRLAGAVVAPIFPRYFVMQAACGLLAFATAWRYAVGRLGWLRFGVIAAAFALVLAGWPIVGVVEGYRFQRYAGDEVARVAFGQWHAVSLVMNLACLLLAGVGVALAAVLPARNDNSIPPT